MVERFASGKKLSLDQHGPSLLPSAGHVKAPLQQLHDEHQHHVHNVLSPLVTSSAGSSRSIERHFTFTMADETPKPVAPIPRTTRPLSEALLNEKVHLQVPHSPQCSSTRDYISCLEGPQCGFVVLNYPG